MGIFSEWKQNKLLKQKNREQQCEIRKLKNIINKREKE